MFLYKFFFFFFFEKMFIYNLKREKKRETWLNSLLDVSGSNDQQFFAHTLLIDCGSLGISWSVLQLIISSTTNLVKLLMCLGMIGFVWDRYRYFNAGKHSGFKKSSNSIIFSQLMRFNASNLKNPYQNEQLGELLANIDGL